MKTHTNLTGRLGRWSAEHPWRSIGVWLLVIIGAVLAGQAVGTSKLSMSDAGNGSSGQAQAAVARAFPQRATEQVIFHSTTSVASAPTFKAAVTDVVRKVEATGQVSYIRSPYAPDARGQISRNGHSALLVFDVKGDMNASAKRVAPVLAAVSKAEANHPGISIRESGMASLMKAFNDSLMKDFKQAERMSVPVALFVLLFAFGALVAALLPVTLSLTAVFGAMGLLAFASHLNPVDQSASSVLLLVGMAVGVDYALFYVKREREERAKGADHRAALSAAAATSGHSVLVSGLTVLVAMAGLFLAGDKVFAGIAWAAMLVVALAMVGSLTVLPAMLSLLGDRINKGRIPFVSRLQRSERGEGAWGWALDKVLRRPVAAVLISAGALLFLAAPVLHMHTASIPAQNDLSQSLPVVQTYNQIQATFPGGPEPALVVVQAHDVTAPAVRNGVVSLERAAMASGQMNEPMATQVSPDRSVAVVSISLAGNGEDAASNRAMHTLRDQVVPATIGRVPGTTVNVGGLMAQNADWNHALHRAIPTVFAFVLVLAFLLLLVTFRSVVIAAKAIVLNLLSVGAAYGVLVWVFQDGHGQGLLHFHSSHSITSWLPIFMFVLLFGLSMDYHVFILSRIREGHLAGQSTDNAISTGIKSSAGTVTAAAAVMVMVFLIFASLSSVSMKETGIGLATAVLLDATLVRVVLLPASMKLLGEWNWYLPAWLVWIPRVGQRASESVPVIVSLTPPVAPAEVIEESVA